MEIRLAQMEVVPGNPKKNFEKMHDIISGAIADKVDVLAFPELCISGYLIGDMWEETEFIDDCIYYGQKVAEYSTDITIIFGNVDRVEGKYGTDGRPALINCAFIAYGGEITYCQPKALLPNYREFEEPRHFQTLEWYLKEVDGRTIDEAFEPVDINGVQFGITICEDGWDRDYDLKPISSFAKNGAELILNLSCSPFTTGKNIARDRTFSAHAKDNGTPVLYVNSIGLQNNGKTIFSFDGSTVAYNNDGEKIWQLSMFEEAFIDITYDEQDKNIMGAPLGDEKYEEIAEIYEALKYGLRAYLAQCGLERVVIGSSGGVDSAVAAALYAEVVGPNNLLLVNMPSEYNSQTTIGLSAELANNLNCFYTSVPIGDSVDLTKTQIHNKHVMTAGGNQIDLKLTDFDLENVQARDRSSRILSAMSAAFKGVFTNNGNKTETTVGYCTLYGDHAGFLAALADLWKTQVYELGRYINRNGVIIPESIFDIQPSAELSADQSLDEGKGDPIVYWYHDVLFKAWVERWNRIGPTEVLEWYYNRELFKNLGIDRPEADIEELFPRSKDFIADLERWWKLFKGMAIAKRVQAPPVLAVSRRAFGFDYRETMNCVYFSRRYEEIKAKLLGVNV